MLTWWVIWSKQWRPVACVLRRCNYFVRYSAYALLYTWFTLTTLLYCIHDSLSTTLFPIIRVYHSSAHHSNCTLTHFPPPNAFLVNIPHLFSALDVATSHVSTTPHPLNYHSFCSRSLVAAPGGGGRLGGGGCGQYRSRQRGRSCGWSGEESGGRYVWWVGWSYGGSLWLTRWCECRRVNNRRKLTAIFFIICIWKFHSLGEKMFVLNYTIN